MTIRLLHVLAALVVPAGILGDAHVHDERAKWDATVKRSGAKID